MFSFCINLAQLIISIIFLLGYYGPPWPRGLYKRSLYDENEDSTDVSDYFSLPPDENSNITTNQDKVTATANPTSEEHETILISSDEESVIEILTTRHDISSIFKTITESSYNAIKSKLNYKPPPTITVKHNSNSSSNKENQYIHNKKQKLSSSSSSSSTKQMTLDSFTTTTATNNNKKAL